MYYIYLILAAILIGISIGAVLSRRNTILTVGSLLAIVLGIATMATGSWQALVAGTVVYLFVQLFQRDNRASA